MDFALKSASDIWMQILAGSVTSLTLVDIEQEMTDINNSIQKLQQIMHINVLYFAAVNSIPVGVSVF